MKKERLTAFLPYVGIPVIGAIFLIICASRMDLFNILLCELIIIFGYIASVSDINTKKIPNILVLSMLIAWTIAVIPKLIFDTDTAVEVLKNSVLGLLVGGGLFLLVYLISRKGMGGGDVKFMAVTGLYIGFTGILSAMLYGSVLAALVGLVLLLAKKIGRKGTIPLAPFLYTGILITVFYM